MPPAFNAFQAACVHQEGQFRQNQQEEDESKTVQSAIQQSYSHRTEPFVER